MFSSFDRPRRRFVQDGEVPVTVIHPRPRQGLDSLGPTRAGASPQERAESAEAVLATERAAREHAERLLREAQATILDLRTKQGHAELARAEADDAVTALRVELATAQGALAAAQEALARAPAPGLPARRGRKPRLFAGVAPAADMPAYGAWGSAGVGDARAAAAGVGDSGPDDSSPDDSSLHGPGVGNAWVGNAWGGRRSRPRTRRRPGGAAAVRGSFALIRSRKRPGRR